MTHPRWNRPALIAAGLFAATAAIHALVGGPEINAVVRVSALDPMVRAVTEVVWHAATLLFVVLAAGTARAARHPNPAVLWIALAIAAGFMGLFIALGLARLGNLTVMPQWVLFGLIIAALTLGLRPQRGE